MDTNFRQARSYAQLLRGVYDNESFIYSQDSSNPQGKAAMLEISHDVIAELRELFGFTFRCSTFFESVVNERARTRGDNRIFAVTSYSRIVGLICADTDKKTTLLLDPAEQHLYSHTTHEQIMHWRGSVDYIDQSLLRYNIEHESDEFLSFAA